MAERGYWAEGYWGHRYWSESYWPDEGPVVEVLVEDDGAAWWIFPELRRSMGFDKIPPPPLQIPTVQGVIHASLGRIGLSGIGVALYPPRPVVRPSMPEVRLPVSGRGLLPLSPLGVFGNGRADLSKGKMSVPLVGVGISGVGASGTAGMARVGLGAWVDVRARVDHNVCTEAELLALVSVARQQLDRMDEQVSEEELLLLVSTAAKHLWDEAQPLWPK